MESRDNCVLVRAWCKLWEKPSRMLDYGNCIITINTLFYQLTLNNFYFYFFLWKRKIKICQKPKTKLWCHLLLESLIFWVLESNSGPCTCWAGAELLSHVPLESLILYLVNEALYQNSPSLSYNGLYLPSLSWEKSVLCNSEESRIITIY